MFIAALYTTAKIWKQPKYPSTDEWEKQMHMMVYYSALKRNGILIHAIIWINLEM